MKFIHLLKHQKFWCPLCLQDMRLNKLSIYEKLLWNINHYNVCHEHLVKLVDTCPNCKSPQSVLNSRSKNGYCWKCNSWFGDSKIERMEISDEEIKYSRQIGYIISQLNQRENLKEDLIKLFKEVDQNFLLGNSKKETCKKFLGVGHSAFNRFCSGKAVPLLFLVKLGLNLGIDLNEKLDKKVTLPTVHKNKKYNHTNNSQEVLEYLKGILNSTEIVSLQRISSDLGVKLNTLDYRFHEIMLAIRKKNMNNGFINYDSVIENFEDIQIQLKRYLKDNSSYKSLTQLSNEIGSSTNKIRKHFPTLWEEIKFKNDKIRKMGLNKNKGVKKPKLDITNLKILLVEIIDTIITEPIPIVEICKKLNVSRPTLRKYLPDLLERIKNKNKEVIKERSSYTLSKRKELVISTIISFHSEGIYPSMRLVEDKLPFKLIHNNELCLVWRSTMKELGIPYKQN